MLVRNRAGHKIGPAGAGGDRGSEVAVGVRPGDAAEKLAGTRPCPRMNG